MTVLSKKRYAAFYTYPIFWVDKNILFQKIENGESINLLEKIFERITPEHEIVLLRDGLVLYREESLEEEYIVEQAKFQNDITR